MTSPENAVSAADLLEAAGDGDAGGRSYRCRRRRCQSRERREGASSTSIPLPALSHSTALVRSSNSSEAGRGAPGS